MGKTPVAILPLYPFFERLRQNEFPLGVDDYENFLYTLKYLKGITPYNYAQYLQLLQIDKALHIGAFPKAELLQLCRLLWLKPNQSVRLFEDLFEENYKLDFDEFMPKKSVDDTGTKGRVEGEKVLTTEEKVDVLNKPEDTQKAEQSVELQAEQTITNEKAQPTFVRIGISERQKESLLGLSNITPETEKSKFLFTDHYYPVDLRKVQQNLRTLPTYGLLQQSQELDIEETIEITIEKGFFSEFVAKKQKIPSSHILLLIDHQGSMVAFNQLTKDIRLEMKAVFMPGKNAPVKSMHTYYFFNTIGTNLFENTTHTQFTSFQRVLDNLRGKSSYVVIISDAGAARRNYNMLRVNTTKEILQKLRSHTQKIVWLNPMPMQRWTNTSAAEIAKSVAMFEASENGIKNATDVLKGSNIKLFKSQ